MTNLNFTQDASGRYVASFTSTGDAVAVQLQRSAKGDLIFYANIGSMPKIVMQALSEFYAGKDVLRAINVPEGVVITISSATSVTTGGYE